MKEAMGAAAAAREQIDRTYNWWAELTGNRGEEGRQQGDRAAQARLRRCRRPIEALMVPAALSLVVRLPSHDPDHVAALAAVLAHVREDDGAQTIARAIGRAAFNQEDSAKLSEGRFRRLMQSESAEELQRAMTRLMDFMGQRASVRDLADAMLYWTDTRRRRWTFDYYAVRVAAPDEPPPAKSSAGSDSPHQPSV